MRGTAGGKVRAHRQVEVALCGAAAHNVPLLGDGDLDSQIEGECVSINWAATFLFEIMMLAVQIVMLNLLIAIMSDSYEQVKEDEIRQKKEEQEKEEKEKSQANAAKEQKQKETMARAQASNSDRGVLLPWALHGHKSLCGP